MKDKISKIIAGTALCSMIVTTSAPVFAYTKSETVYSKLDNEGNAYKTIVTTHIENSDNEQIIEDLSNLINIENTNGDETFEKQDNKLVWQANGNDIYYQGESTQELPVTCNIKYELNGEEILAKDIEGKSGNVKITIEYTNKEAREVTVNGRKTTMYIPFVVVAGTVYDNTNNKNISITNGKLVDDGSKTALVGMALPGLQESLNLSKKEIDIPTSIEITLDTTDFEQNSIITYVTAKMVDLSDLEIFDKLDTVYAKADTLKESSKQIVDGANKVNEGVGLLSSKLGALPQNAVALYNGAQELNAGVNGEEGLVAGISALKQKLTDLITTSIGMLQSNNQVLNSEITQLTAEAGELKTQITNLTVLKAKLIDETDKTAMQTTIDELTTRANGLTARITALTKQEKTNEAVISKITPIEASQTQITALEKGLQKISAGTKALEENLATLTNSTKELPSSLQTLKTGTQSLAEGATKFDTEGIQKVCNLINGDVKNISKRVEKLNKLSNEYNNFGMISEGNSGEVKFVMIVDGLK